jgi:hypothetical protein
MFIMDGENKMKQIIIFKLIFVSIKNSFLFLMYFIIFFILNVLKSLKISIKVIVA